LNALANRITRSPDVVKQNIYGFTVGNPIIKNKLFNFFVYEHWYNASPDSLEMTMPTAQEKGGDFSQALQSDGQTLRVIYDPTTTMFDPATNTVTRTPISCEGRANVICAGALNPTAKALMPYIWGPNTTPDNPDGLNNLKVTYPMWEKYWNWSDRVDYNASDKWRMFAHYSRFNTRLGNPNWSDNHSLAVATGDGIMDAMSSGLDVLYMANRRTTLDIRLGVNYIEDDCCQSQLPNLDVWKNLWPNSDWYVPLQDTAFGIFFPAISWSGIGGADAGPTGGTWIDHLRVYEPSVTLTHELGKNYLKFGWQFRYGYSDGSGPSAGYLNFDSIDTGSTFLSNYNPSVDGDQWASTLLGVVDSGYANINPVGDQIHEQQWGFFFQDDFRLNPRTTLNLGLRWERETGPADNNHWLIKTLDLKQPIPELQGFQIWTPAVLAAANLPAGAANIPTLVQPSWNGAAVRTSASDPRVYDAPWNVILPRAGIAYRLNDKTALRAGYSRFAVAQISIRGDESESATNGYSQSTNALGPLNGIPRDYFDNPYPTGGAYPNPVVLPPGNSLGRYQGLGNPWWGFFDGRTLKVPMNDRFNFNVQRQLPEQLRFDGTLFMMFEHNAQDVSMWAGHFWQNVNMMNPMYSYQYQGLLNTAVPNPFYNAFPSNIMPGVLGTEATVPLSQLLRPYPQYGDLYQMGWPGYKDHYYGLALSVTRPMSKGWTFLGTYNYSLQSHSWFYDDIATYNNHLQVVDRGYPRHNIRFSGTYELPLGRGRKYLSNAPRVVDEILGGWATSQIFYFRSGDLLGNIQNGMNPYPNYPANMFPTTGIVCDPTKNIPAGMWFNANCLVTAPPFTRATFPLYYEGLRGPRYWDIDSTIVKSFRINERFNLEMRLEAYNVTNTFMPSDPNICGVSQCGLGVAGVSTWMATDNYGRELQGSLRLHF